MTFGQKSPSRFTLCCHIYENAFDFLTVFLVIISVPW